MFRPTRIRNASALLLVAGLSSLYPAQVMAGDIPCPPGFGPATVDGNLVITGECRLDGTTVKGNVLLYSGGSLIASGITVIGSVQSDSANFVDIDNSRINGSVQLDKMVGGTSVISDSSIGGSVQIKDNRSRVEAIANDVTQDVQAFNNSGGVVIAANDIDGNLQCKDNLPAPAGSDNRVAGNKEDQCSSLQAPGSAPGVSPLAGSGSGSSSGGGSSGGGSLSLFGSGLLLMLAGLRGLNRYRGRRA